MNLFDKFSLALPYAQFLEHYANDGQKERWRQVHEQVKLTDGQRRLLGAFTRHMHVLCLAGAWCGDCINQCPIFEHFAAVQPLVRVRYLDRDDHPDVQRELRLNAGDRVPVVVYFSEDGAEAARYGERTLNKYRHMMRDQLGPACPSVVVAPPLQVVQDWLNEFERVQWLLRLSPRLRQLHGD
jgi:hypothetical protein